MLEKFHIRHDMEVTTDTGTHVGTVDGISRDHLKLTRADSSDGTYHYISLQNVEKVEGNRIYLKQGTPIPMGAGAP
ncbi:DUF2171 domain-containing protein [Novosphingobium mangrovi (ex Huang et al. 2023)]|uniref:DUF2171 domain-containing protein n=1 Tax=Novosphingobium mangrovi (ex Huang et al. 2023) TaxID=2976432 RepID=A0ABT2I1E3_9SPHN|nr:DUF2171 domain-containing protein [Novosphingobium mangrovi (ex Huang et al. 2023)]MCT2398427.1 DUF2171 domain-containing protein [Novosphingobium mangrovi (ex Huang et al. 2023)]